MELVLERTYYPSGVNGNLYNGAQLVCRTIELPWKENQPQVSCIPEGTYSLQKRYSKRFGWHLILHEVPNRRYILVHPANHALSELRGCIAPVTEVTGEGRGSFSRLAQAKLHKVVNSAFERNEEVLLTIR